MNAERTEETSKRDLLEPVRLVSTFWGLAAVLLLGAYSVLHAVDQAPAAVATSSSSAAAQEQQRSPAFASFVPPASYPEVERVPPILYLTCGPDDVRVGGSLGAGRYLITMRLDQVPDDIRALISGADTVFPKDVWISLSPCIKGMVDRGELP
jgi:hypothetical protein